MTQCRWCQEKAVTTIEVEPAKRGKDKRTGSMVIKREALMVPVCRDHKDIVNRQPPFYTCGCHYVEGSLRCPRHNNLLRQPHRDSLTKELVKDAPKVEEITIR